MLCIVGLQYKPSRLLCRRRSFDDFVAIVPARKKSVHDRFAGCKNATLDYQIKEIKSISGTMKNTMPCQE